MLPGWSGAVGDFRQDEPCPDEVGRNAHDTDRPAATDLTGYRVEATDGGIGSIDEPTYDVGSACLVVDSGPWIFGCKVLLPAGTVQRIDHDAGSRT
jgi:hypothetical protein